MTGRQACSIGRCYGDYVIEALIARGGVAEIYRARHAIIGRLVALKTIRPELRGRTDLTRRMELEARALAEIDHPNVVKVHDAGRDAEIGLYVVMELLAGDSLRALMLRCGHLRLADALRIAIGIAEASQALHLQGIYHRDIKPENVVVAPLEAEARGGLQVGCSLKLLDLGAAKIPRYDEQTITMSGSMFGTAKYMSPEQVHGQPITRASDQYSLGVILYEMLAGRHPLASEARLDDVEWARRHVTREPLPLSAAVPGIPADLWAIVARALSKDPGGRFRSMKDFARALTSALWAHEAAPSVRPESEAWLQAAAPTSSASAATLTISRQLVMIDDTLPAGARLDHGVPQAPRPPSASTDVTSPSAGTAPPALDETLPLERDACED